MDYLCPAGEVIFKRQDGPCPALRQIEHGFACGLVLDPRSFAPTKTAKHGANSMRDAMLILIGSGVGCDAAAIGEDVEPVLREKMFKAAAAIPNRRVFAALKRWGL
jgi:hypothetical protein